MNAPLSSGFAPNTVRPPRRRLRGVAALSAGARNPIELWDEELFRIPGREIRQLGRRVIELADPSLFHAVLVQEADCFTRSELQLRFTRPLVGSGILAASGDNWKRQRKAAAPSFRPAALDALAPVVESAGRRAAGILAKGEATADVAPVMMQATLDVIASLLGAPENVLDQSIIDRAAHDYLAGIGPRAVAELLGAQWLYERLPMKGRQAAHAFRQQAATLIRASRGDATLERLRHAVGCDAHALEDSIIALIAAGAETAAIGLSWALHLVAHDPIVQDRLAQEYTDEIGDAPLSSAAVAKLQLHKHVVQETLRLFPPIALVQRTAVKPVTIGDWRLQAGDEVVCAIYVMHRAPRIWASPDVFDPDRFAKADPQRHRFSFLPFGAGQHACLGMPLAYLEMIFILATILRTVRISPAPAFRAQPVMQLTLRPRHGVRLQFAPRGRVRSCATQPPQPDELVAV